MNSTDLIIYIFLILLLIFIFNKISNNTDDILSDNLENYSNHYDIPINKKQKVLVKSFVFYQKYS